MKITLASQFSLVELIENKVYNLNFGSVSKGTPLEASINISGASFLLVKKSCGCTSPSITMNTDGTFNVNIAYDSKKLGTINQFVKLTVETQEPKAQQEIVFNLKGTIS